MLKTLHIRVIDHTKIKMVLTRGLIPIIQYSWFWKVNVLYCRRKLIVTQICLNNFPGKPATVSNSGMNVIGVTKHFLIRFNAHSPNKNPYLAPIVRPKTHGQTGKPTTSMKPDSQLIRVHTAECSTIIGTSISYLLLPGLCNHCI